MTIKNISLTKPTAKLMSDQKIKEDSLKKLEQKLEDRDNDGIPDKNDACPDQPWWGNSSPPADISKSIASGEDGCPDIQRTTFSPPPPTPPPIPPPTARSSTTSTGAVSTNQVSPASTVTTALAGSSRTSIGTTSVSTVTQTTRNNITNLKPPLSPPSPPARKAKDVETSKLDSDKLSKLKESLTGQKVKLPAPKQDLDQIARLKEEAEKQKEIARDLTIKVPQTLIVKAPPPVRGINRAKIVISTSCGESIEEFYYTYADVCVTPRVPNISKIPGITDNDIVNAYEQCLDQIADLFCEDLSPDSIDKSRIRETKEDPVILYFKNNNKNKNEYEAEDFVELNWSIEGSGTYILSLSGDKNVIKREAFSDAVTTGITLKIPEQAIIDRLSRRTGSINYVLSVYNYRGKNVGQVPLTIKIRKPEKGTRRKRIVNKQLAFDNDLGDAKKEVYYLSDFVADYAKNLREYTRYNYKTRKPGQFLITKNNQNKDNFRELFGRFWIKESDTRERLVFAKDTNNTLIDFNSLFTTTTDFIDLHQSSLHYLDKVFYEQNWNVLDTIPTSDTWDVSYTHQRMYTAKEAAQTPLPFNSRILDVKTEYNFYNKKYEEILTSPGLQEILLPNMYFLNLNDQAIETGKTESQEDDISLDPDIQKLLRLDQYLPDNTAPLQVDSYYNYYVDNFKNNNITNENGLLNRAKNIIIPYSFLNSIEEYSNKNQMFPMFVDIKFDTYPFEIVGSLLKSTPFGQQFITNCISIFQNNLTERFEFVKQEEDNDGSSLFRSSNRYIDVTQLISVPDNIDDNFVFLGNYGDFINTLSNPLAKLLQSAAFKTKLNKILKIYSRSYKDILDGKKCYKETLFYKIAKYGADPVVPIQEIYIPNDPDKNYLRYIDTQVVYDKRYTYRIYSYDFVIANKYKRVYNPELEKTQLQNFIQNQIKLLLIENVYEEFEVKIGDKPPLSPEVNLVTFKDIDNRLLILLNGNSIETQQKEVLIREEDKKIFEKTRKAQKLSKDDLISFGGDDIIKKYQIFVTTTPPRSYADFRNAEMTEISTIIDPKRPEARTTAKSYISTLVPNKKHYYTFRCIDIHDQLSNPSLVYEVEIINEEGTIFPIIKEWRFPQQEQKEATKNFRRFMMIKPQILQEILKIDTSKVETKEKLLEKIKTLGVQDSKVWEKKYKMRIVSKNTGKIYDINFAFDLKKEIID